MVAYDNPQIRAVSPPLFITMISPTISNYGASTSAMPKNVPSFFEMDGSLIFGDPYSTLWFVVEGPTRWL